MFERTSQGQWPSNETEKLAFPSNYVGDLALDGNRLFASERSESSLQAGSGAVLMYEKSNGQWELRQTIKAEAPGEGDQLSEAAWSGSVLAGYAMDDETAVDSGAAYLFSESNGAFSQLVKIKAPDADMDDRFGLTVLSGTTLAVSAYTDDEFGTNAGAIYIYKLVDCNQNDVPDSCDIANGFSNDFNRNGTPDECEFQDPFGLLSDPLPANR